MQNKTTGYNIFIFCVKILYMANSVYADNNSLNNNPEAKKLFSMIALG